METPTYLGALQAYTPMEPTVVSVNSDDNPALSSRYGIRSIPTLIRLQQGRETARQSGAIPAQKAITSSSLRPSATIINGV